MKFQTRNRHVLHLLFPASLLFVFAASSLAVLILAANIYASTTDRLQANDQNRTALSYISEKIRQNDRDGALGAASIEGIPCLSLTGSYDGSTYVTYIYEYEGMLKEIFMKEGTRVLPKNGSDIIPVSSFDMKCLYGHTWQFTVIDSKGFESSIVLSERSTQ